MTLFQPSSPYTMSLSHLLSAVCALLCLSAIQTTLAATYPFAVYSLTNDLSNSVNIFGGYENGTLIQTGSILTGGKGWNTSASFQAQNALTVVGGYLFAVNPGSGSISQFSINSQDPTQLTLIGSPVPLGADWPTSVGGYASGSRQLLCATSDGAVNPGITCFTFSSTGLTPIANGARYINESFSTPPPGGRGPSQVSFTPDGKGIVIINLSPPPYTPFYLWTIDANNVISTSPILSAQTGTTNFAGVFDPTDGAFVSVDPHDAALQLSSVTTTGTPAFTPLLNPRVSLAPYKSACWISRSSSTGRFYVTNTGSGVISELTRSGNSFTFNSNTSSSRPLGGATVTDSVVVNYDGKEWLYVLAGPTDTIVNFQLSTTSAPVVVQNVTATTTMKHPTGLAVYYTPDVTTSSSSSTGSPAAGSSSTAPGSASSSTAPNSGMTGATLSFMTLAALLLSAIGLVQLY